MRVSTSSETMVIRCSSVSTLTRIVCTLDGGAPSAGSGSARAASAAAVPAPLSGAGPGRGAEGAFEVVQRDLARLQRPLQDLVDEGSGGDLRLGLGFRRTRRGGERLESADEVGIGAFGLGRAALELGEDRA